MTKKEAGHLGGIATSCKFGIERCEHCGQLILNEHFKTIGAKGGQKGIAVVQRKYSAEQRREWARRGGRPRNETNDKGQGIPGGQDRAQPDLQMPPVQAEVPAVPAQLAACGREILRRMS